MFGLRGSDVHSSFQKAGPGSSQLARSQGLLFTLVAEQEKGQPQSGTPRSHPAQVTPSGASSFCGKTLGDLD